MRIWLNQDKMNAFGIAYNDISTAMVNENVELPPGKIYGNNTEMTIKTLGRLTTEKDFRDVIRLLAANSYPTSGWVQRVPMDELVTSGFEALRDQRAMKVLVDVRAGLES